MSDLTKILRPLSLLLTQSVCILLFISQNVFAQSSLNENKRPSQYVLSSWNTEDGLRSESINELLQTPDGYIWIATYAGLHRFDGKDFTIFNSKNSTIPSANVGALEKGLNNELWLGTLHGIAKYEEGEFIVPKELEKVSDYSIEDMLITKAGDIWFSTKSNQLYKYSDDKLTEFTNDFEVQNSTVLTITEGSNNTIYFGTDDSQLIIYAQGSVRKEKLDSDINGINILFYKNELLYLGTGRGLYTWDEVSLKKSSILPETTINSLRSQKKDVLWIGTMRGLFRVNEKTNSIDSLTESSGMPNNIVRDLLFDLEENLWVGTYRSGIFLLSDGSITSYTESDGLVSNIITSVTELNDNSFLLGNENGELNRLRNGIISKYIPPISIPSERLKNLFTDNKGRVWVSTYGGLVLLDGNKSKHFNIKNGFPDNFIRVVFQDSKGSIWVGTKNAGLAVFETLDQWQQITIDDGLSSNYIMSIEEDSEGRIIVGTISGLNILKDKKVVKSVTTEDGLPSSFTFSTLSKSDYIWISSNDGLTGYSENEIVNFNTENGMPSNIIYDVIEDSNGNLWMPSENSILSISNNDLQAAINDPNVSIKVRQFDKSYGMKNSHCLGAVLSFTDSKGDFWIPTLGGIVRLNPDEITTPDFNPRTIIENIHADNARIKLDEVAIIPAQTNRLLIDFTGISYAQTDLLQFRYRLEPFDQGWVNATESRNGLYTNLAPGNYTFQIQTGLDNNFNSGITSQKIIIEASWYQTLWARVLIGVLIVLLALLFYWIRTRNLTINNLKLEATVAERTKALEAQKMELKEAIEQLKNAQEQMVQSDKMASLGILAAGVAHEINNPLNFIQGGVEGLEQMLSRNEDLAQDDYSALLKAIKEGISRASTIVLSLNEFSHSSEKNLEPCDIYHLIENCLTMIQYRLKAGIELKKEFSGEEAIVTGNNGKLHQAFLNILTNSIQAIDKKGTITIRTSIKKKILTLEFIDSGQGIKPENLKKITEPFFSTKDPGKGTGLGLSITYAIINEHGGSLTYSSEWGHGTTATIKLPVNTQSK